MGRLQTNAASAAGWAYDLTDPAQRLDPTIEGDMLVALMVGFVAMSLVFTWLMVHRFRVAWLEQQADRVDLDAALAARRAEAADPDPATGSDATDQPDTGNPATDGPDADDEGTSA